MTGCGNYGLVGYACGRVDKFNMQSGAHRGTFWAEAPVGHTGSIHGVEVTGLNEMVISASFDGSVKLWDFEERRLLHSFETASPVTQMQLNRDNSLLAVCCDDLKVRVYDVSSRRLVRVFQGHTNRITDVCLSGDGRWVITASADRSLRIYDIPTARLIDWVPARPCPSCLLDHRMNLPYVSCLQRHHLAPAHRQWQTSSSSFPQALQEFPRKRTKRSRLILKYLSG